MPRLLPALALVVALVVAIAAAAPSAHAVERQHGVYRGRSVDATFTSTDGCLTTEVGVFGLANTIQWLPGTPYEDANLWVNVTQHDTCTGQRTLYAFGYASGASVSVKPSLGGAAVSATVEAYDWVSFSWITLGVDVVWEAVDGRVREGFHETEHGDGYVAFYHSVGTYRPATASGSVLLQGTNLTPAATGDAAIASTQEGELFVAPHNDPD